MESVLSSNATAVRNFADLRRRAAQIGPRRVAVAGADDDVALEASAAALRAHIAFPVLIGDPDRIRFRAHALGLTDLAEAAEFIPSSDPARTAVALARDGHVDLLLKGHLRTDELLRPILDRDTGLRTGRLLSDVAFFEHRGPDGPRLVGISDGGLNVAPTLEQKEQIILGAIEVLHSLHIHEPRIAIMSAVEVVSEAIPSTVDAAELTRRASEGRFGDALVFGPLALDNALLEWAAKAKGIDHPVAGHADCLIVPNIEAGNLMAKAIVFIAGSEFAHVITGARVPILIPSRVESPRDKVNAIALGVLYAAR
jgi:phosphate butyryltransferase